MKLRGWVVLVAGVFCLNSTVFAADKTLSDMETSAPDVAAEAPKAAPKAAPAPKIDEKKMQKLREMIEVKKKELNGTEWKIDVGTHDTKVKGGPDVLSFQDSMVSLDSFAKRGYGPTNYTISVPSEEAETAVFETMQVGKEGTIFIRGEWKKDVMQGIINEQIEGGKANREWWFGSTGKAAISPVSDKKEESAVATPEPVEAPKALSSDENGVKAVRSVKSDKEKDKKWF